MRGDREGGGGQGPSKKREVMGWGGGGRSRTKEGDRGTINEGGDKPHEKEGNVVLFDGSDNYIGCEN